MVDKDLFLAGFRDLFDETDPQEIQFETQYKDLEEWSSLTVLSLIVHFEDNYKVKLSPVNIQESSTVDDLYKLIV
ncbi:acyl carrier protein [Pedobacter frigiditerrae]|uniref:Acyl carrier protein n=1 Tax=Pedobacter frigiditerrae TaxID=2530452 RepID=A0A4R0N329_9SPHI|nr:phosphopantetheine-binding protein [Pedobacter frigiditerrae]TCC94155.1 acyl carrier protein [Pedobacter frigiditerrae]